MADEATPSTQGRRVFPPPVTPETKRFWEAAANGRLLYGYCRKCREAHYYPRPFCPFCLTSDVEWKEASGNAVIYTYSIMHRSSSGDYAIAYVTLEEGPSLLTNIVDSDLASIAIGKAARLVFKPSEGGPPVPFFKLA